MSCDTRIDWSDKDDSDGSCLAVSAKLSSADGSASCEGAGFVVGAGTGGS